MKETAVFVSNSNKFPLEGAFKKPYEKADDIRVKVFSHASAHRS